jgi:hypothetical protein
VTLLQHGSVLMYLLSFCAKGWIYEYIPAMRPDMEDDPALVVPRVCRWAGHAISQPAKEASDIKKVFSQLRVSDVSLPSGNS